MHCIISLWFPGDKVLIRCVKSLKPYSGKSVADEDDDEDDDEDYDNEARRGAVPSQGRIMEVDVMSQAYHIGGSDHFHCVSGKEDDTFFKALCFCLCVSFGLFAAYLNPLHLLSTPVHLKVILRLFCCTAVLSCGTKGIPKTAVGLRMNVGKLESRMLCRRMEKDGIIKVSAGL